MNEELTTEPDILLDDEAAKNLYREAAITFMDFSDARDMFVMGYDGDKLLAYECTLLAMGKSEIVGIDSAVALADRFKVEKATVTKIVKKFQEVVYTPQTARFHQPPQPGQRSRDACKKFTTTRKAQLKP